ncbi:MAG: AmmeMemoRadiSam system protein A [Candidatus Promineifilaceae bacterium]|jgi:AmmeMemoRadiSam system protein A
MSNQKPQNDPLQDSELPVLNAQEREELLKLARQAIIGSVSKGSSSFKDNSDQKLDDKAAVFVTLWQPGPANSNAEENNRLRGCIGRLQPDLPLKEAVKYAAVSAATRDPRFVPVRSTEIEDLTIEIAILSPLEEVKNLDEIVIGRDGLVIEAMGRRGLLLPKVATRLNWDREEFLRNVCLKAGLPENTWPGHGKLYKFSTLVFND